MSITGIRQPCIHKWEEGGTRDWGRYHCSACFVPLNVERLIAEVRALRVLATICERRVDDEEIATALDLWKGMR